MSSLALDRRQLGEARGWRLRGLDGARRTRGGESELTRRWGGSTPAEGLSSFSTPARGSVSPRCSSMPGTWRRRGLRRPASCAWSARARVAVRRHPHAARASAARAAGGRLRRAPQSARAIGRCAAARRPGSGGRRDDAARPQHPLAVRSPGSRAPARAPGRRRAVVGPRVAPRALVPGATARRGAPAARRGGARRRRLRAGRGPQRAHDPRVGHAAAPQAV
jgi:hypothetical protein